MLKVSGPVKPQKTNEDFLVIKGNKPPKTIKDFHWVTVGQLRMGLDVWNEFFIDFNVPSYELSFREPLPKNTAVHYDPPAIRFSCKLVDFNKSVKVKNFVPVFKDILREVCFLLKDQMKRKLERIPKVHYSDIGFFVDHVTVGEELPTEGRGYVKSGVFLYFRPPADPLEVGRALLEVNKIHKTTVAPEVKRLLREQLKDMGFTVKSCSAHFTGKPRLTPPFKSLEFYYLPGTLDEWKERRVDPIHFALILPKSRKIVKSFIDMVTSCETIMELSYNVLSFLDTFRDKTQIIRPKLSPWDSRGMWLISLEVNGWKNNRNKEINWKDENEAYWEGVYTTLKEVFTWVREVVEGDNPSQSD